MKPWRISVYPYSNKTGRISFYTYNNKKGRIWNPEKYLFHPYPNKIGRISVYPYPDKTGRISLFMLILIKQEEYLFILILIKQEDYKTLKNICYPYPNKTGRIWNPEETIHEVIPWIFSVLNLESRRWYKYWYMLQGELIVRPQFQIKDIYIKSFTNCC